MEEKEVRLFSSGTVRAPLVILHTVHGEGQAVYEEVCKRTKKEFSIAAIGNLNWNEDMSPWAVPSVFAGDTPCTGGADRYLKNLTDRILPELLKQTGIQPSYIAIAGYSLAGLFAVYSLYRTDVFRRAASASGSFWFPEFLEFAKKNKMAGCPEKIYFSLGDKEAKTRNQILKTVQENTKELYEFYMENGVTSVFELNPGNHFQDDIMRMAKGIHWILSD